ncbi:DNA polymerase III subunit alpha [Candidatus Falkowbacteria bacterium CG11_big_fil_rev_8_21_14_0_20_39_10]|uniref:DNA polymerase III subunit alpha n=1 Tax=Candidatus Falkowbacteria bacterium CG11_big_fil_rev_8_21_14_0_20_39_10 TaxID=1974570 RepID=A0A2M6K9A7_9BACT|nr:MAG: DNA polymerase III subunit alpha [Candidatus Falkowbacteria bacterium CG11_big_fil_rev_8_21_14_0_20_39_10]
MSFVHLHNHTHYSLLDGLTKIDELIAAAKTEGAPAVAITDHGTMYGAIEFYQKCQAAGIKPIIGVEAYLAPGSRHDKVARADEKNYHLLLLAKDNEGYKNLIKLTSIAHLEGFYYKPRVDWEILKKYHQGLIALTACLSGEIPKLILAGKLEKAKKMILEYNELFGQDNFYLELMRHPELPEYEQVNKELIKFSRELNIPVAATNDVHYLKKEDDEAQDILLCLQNKKKKEDTDRMKMIGLGDFSMRSAREMKELFADIPEAVANTVKIADKCNLEIELGSIQLPFFQVPEGFDENSYLKKLCQAGLIKFYNQDEDKVDKKIKERMDYELEVIAKMGMASYFLIVADFVNWAKQKGIVVGPGRGSAAGSLVCYLTGITGLDPLKYDLLFERFLNPDRISMPDIDLDFADTRRDEVIRYVEEKYGQDHVAQIITFGTMAARAAVRDVGRVLGYPYDYCDKLAKIIPMFTNLDKALKTVPELKEIYKEEAAKKIVDYARRLEGVARHSSTHACGVLITKEPLTEHVPLQYASSSDRTIVSQYSLHPIEDLGLLKMDFLGLKNLTIIESAIRIIKNTRGLEIDINEIPLDDKKTYHLFKAGETTGIFQFESSGMKRYLRELEPTEFEDIIAMVALYRPGPMEWIPDFVASKHGKKKAVYLHPKLEPILSKTYGVAIYQEQVMQIARDLAGFTMAEADVLRKAMGKKIAKLLSEQKEKFIDGCVQNSIAKEMAEKIFSFIEPFAGYGFNRSHAACYALIGYQTAYLKAHWPTEFMAALLTADQQNTDRIAIEIEECRHMGIDVLPPDINESFGSFTVVTSGTKDNLTAGEQEEVDTIRFGLKAIKNVGGHIAEAIIKERKENGAYKDIFNFLERVTDKDLNKKSLESLIKCGGLDNLGERGQLLGNTETLLIFNKEISKAQNSKQDSLFAQAPSLDAGHKVQLKEIPAADNKEKLAWEKELLGLYISEHPFNEYKEQLKDIVSPLIDLAQYLKNDFVNIAGVITSVKKIITRNNESMLFVKIEDAAANTEIIVFPRLLKQTPDFWQEGLVIIVQGKLSDKDQEIKLLANKAVKLESENINSIIKEFSQPAAVNGYKNYSSSSQTSPGPAPDPVAQPLGLVFKENLGKVELDKLKNIFLNNQGQSKVYFKLENNGQANVLETGFRVNNSDSLAKAIKEKFGQQIKIVDKS